MGDAEREGLALECMQALPESLRGVGDAPEAREVPPPAFIHNIVSTSVIAGSDMPIDLNRLSVLLPCSSYDRRRFAAITVRIDRPRCTALLFTSGKLVVTGVKSWYECLLASMIIAKMMRQVLVGRHYQVVACQVRTAPPPGAGPPFCDLSTP